MEESIFNLITIVIFFIFGFYLIPRWYYKSKEKYYQMKQEQLRGMKHGRKER